MDSATEKSRAMAGPVALAAEDLSTGEHLGVTSNVDSSSSDEEPCLTSFKWKKMSFPSVTQEGYRSSLPSERCFFSTKLVQPDDSDTDTVQKVGHYMATFKNSLAEVNDSNGASSKVYIQRSSEPILPSILSSKLRAPQHTKSSSGMSKTPCEGSRASALNDVLGRAAQVIQDTRATNIENVSSAKEGEHYAALAPSSRAEEVGQQRRCSGAPRQRRFGEVNLSVTVGIENKKGTTKEMEEHSNLMNDNDKEHGSSLIDPSEPVPTIKSNKSAGIGTTMTSSALLEMLRRYNEYHFDENRQSTTSSYGSTNSRSTSSREVVLCEL